MSFGVGQHLKGRRPIPARLHPRQPFQTPTQPAQHPLQTARRVTPQTTQQRQRRPTADALDGAGVAGAGFGVAGEKCLQSRGESG